MTPGKGLIDHRGNEQDALSDFTNIWLLSRASSTDAVALASNFALSPPAPALVSGSSPISRGGLRGGRGTDARVALVASVSDVASGFSS